jgi:hypothetical protein
LGSLMRNMVFLGITSGGRAARKRLQNFWRPDAYPKIP